MGKYLAVPTGFMHSTLFQVLVPLFKLGISSSNWAYQDVIKTSNWKPILMESEHQVISFPKR